MKTRVRDQNLDQRINGSKCKLSGWIGISKFRSSDPKLDQKMNKSKDQSTYHKSY